MGAGIWAVRPTGARRRNAPICNRSFTKPLSCAQHTSRVPIRPNADHFTTSSPLSAFFTQWVCTLAATPPQTAVSPPPIGGNCTTRGSDTPATRRKKASCSAKPPSQPAPSAPRHLQDRRRAAWREKTRPARPLPRLFRDKTRPTGHKTPISGHFERAGRTFSRVQT